MLTYIAIGIIGVAILALAVIYDQAETIRDLTEDNRQLREDAHRRAMEAMPFESRVAWESYREDSRNP